MTSQYAGSVKAIVNVDGAYLRIPATAEGKVALEQQIQTQFEAYQGPQRLSVIVQFLQRTFYGYTPPDLQQEIRQT